MAEGFDSEYFEAIKKQLDVLGFEKKQIYKFVQDEWCRIKEARERKAQREAEKRRAQREAEAEKRKAQREVEAEERRAQREAEERRAQREAEERKAQWEAEERKAQWEFELERMKFELEIKKLKVRSCRQGQLLGTVLRSDSSEVGKPPQQSRVGCAMQVCEKPSRIADELEEDIIDIITDEKSRVVSEDCVVLETGEDMPVVGGELVHEFVEVLQDNGCNGSIVGRDLVAEHDSIEETECVVAMDGESEEAPVAVVKVDVPCLVGMVKAMCRWDPLADLIIENGLRARKPDDPNLSWSILGALTTRTHARRERSGGGINSELVNGSLKKIIGTKVGDGMSIIAEKVITVGEMRLVINGELFVKIRTMLFFLLLFIVQFVCKIALYYSCCLNIICNNILRRGVSRYNINLFLKQV